MDGPFYRTKHLPNGELRGTHRIAACVIDSSASILRQYAELEHEGLVLWAGIHTEQVTYYLSVLAPATEHGRRSVFFDAHAYGEAARRARTSGLTLVAQLHSHPGQEARHSDGDDDLIPLPFEGMLSLVAPCYGARLESIEDLVVHQFQDGRWVHIPEPAFTTIPALEDLREVNAA